MAKGKKKGGKSADKSAVDKVGKADLSEDQEEKLRRVLDQTVKALRVWEGFGSPTLFQAITAANQAVEG